MRITADTNVLVRAAVMDDSAQAAIAAETLVQAEAVAVTFPALCEFVWVLIRGYRQSAAEVAGAIRTLIASASVVVDRRLSRRDSASWKEAAISPTASSPSRAGASAGPSLRPSTRQRRR